jgi:KDO2-lipid IV(A) lauroyltransferase
MPGRRSLWRRLRRATRGPRNAILARALAGGARAFGALPPPVAIGVGRTLGAAAHLVLARDRRLALEHVAFALPGLDVRARRKLVRETFRHAGQSFAELALWPRLRETPDYVTVDRLDLLESALAGGRGVIAVTGHCGNWELLAATIARRFPLSVVARRVNDERFDALVVGFRRGADMEVLARDDPNFVANVREALRRNRIVALLIDQDTRGAGVFVPFFGRPARTPPGAALLALRNRVPLLTVFIERGRDGHHLIRFAPVPMGDERGGRHRATALTADLTAAIEAQIRRVPAQWVWWHERWKRRPNGADSPLLSGGPVVRPAVSTD